ncbi:MAG: glycosyltransferase family 9 protein [Ignavibacteriaceae bacterium]
MDKRIQYKTLFHLTSIVTDILPSSGAKILDVVFKNLLGNKALLLFLHNRAAGQINKVKKFKHILVVSDLNIGDAIICSSGVTALRRIFPDAEIDYVIKKSTTDFFNGNPEISNLIPIFEGAPYPTEDDLSKLSIIIKSKKYDLAVNYSPMIDAKIYGKIRVINYSLITAQLVRNEMFAETINNISYRAYHLISDLFLNYFPTGFNDIFEGPSIYLSDEALETANKFLISNNVSGEIPVIMFNPEASSKFTRIPFNFQVDLLKGLAKFNCTILLGSGYVEKDIEQKLFLSLPAEYREKIVIVPAGFKLDAYTALIDYSDIYITGDTGPLHLAAARKYSGSDGKSLKNKTAIFSVFGGTPPHIYSYDSKTPGFIAANQDAPSRAFIAPSQCRNITCINKLAKTCKTVRCFESLDIDEIISESANHLENARKYRIRNSKLFVK